MIWDHRNQSLGWVARVGLSSRLMMVLLLYFQLSLPNQHYSYSISVGLIKKDRTYVGWGLPNLNIYFVPSTNHILVLNNVVFVRVHENWLKILNIYKDWIILSEGSLLGLNEDWITLNEKIWLESDYIWINSNHL
jgi:hypothetical protein